LITLTLGRHSVHPTFITAGVIIKLITYFPYDIVVLKYVTFIRSHLYKQTIRSKRGILRKQTGEIQIPCNVPTPKSGTIG